VRDLWDLIQLASESDDEPWFASVLALLLMILAVGAWLYIGSAL
jgi:hypothetical protein